MTVQETINEAITYVGNKVPELTKKAFDFLEDSGFAGNGITFRLLSIVITLMITYVILHAASGLKPFIKWLIKIIAGVIILSIAISTFMQATS